jgi:hypothetical protein
MQFLNPGILWLSLLAIIPIALYLFRRKSKVVDVSTLVFFKTLAREHQESAWLRRIKKILSLILTLAMLLGAIFALSRLILSPLSEKSYRTIVILLDRSASMAATEGEGGGVSRLDEAREIIQSRLEGIPEDVGVALIGYDSRPEVIQPRTLKRRELLSRLGEITVRPVAGQTRAALDSAVVLARLETPALIWHVSDSGVVEIDAPAATPDAPPAPAAPAPVDGAADTDALADAAKAGLVLPEGVELETIDIAHTAPVNAGITVFQIRPVPLEHGRFEAFVQVALNRSAPEPVKGKLDVFLGGLLVQPREIELDPGERFGLVLKLEGAEDQLLRLRLTVPGDCLATDNEVLEPLPHSRPIVAAWVRPQEAGNQFRPDPYTEFALRAFIDDYDFEVLAIQPDQWAGSQEGVDVVIFDDCVPETWPENLPVILLNPPGSAGPIRVVPTPAPVPHESVRVGNDQHPVLFRVSSGRVSVSQTSVFEAAGSLEPLWLGNDEPLLAAGEVKGQRLVVMAFSPGRSDRLPLTASFPLLMGNALLWCAETAPGVVEKLIESPTGRVVPASGASVTWTQWQEGGLKTTTASLTGGLLELDRTGVWETDTGQRGAAHLLSRAETDLRPRDPAAADTQVQVRSGLFSGNATWIFLVIIALVLIVESYLFHRHAVY